MKTEQAVEFFGTQQAIATITGKSKQAISQWGECPPAEAQMRLHKASGGKLKAERDVLRFYKELTEGVI